MSPNAPSISMLTKLRVGCWCLVNARSGGASVHVFTDSATTGYIMSDQATEMSHSENVYFHIDMHPLGIFACALISVVILCLYIRRWLSRSLK